jgi:bacterioferritin-associated ferredoxin
MSDIFMFVCICNQVTDKQIRQAAEDGHRSFKSLSVELNVGTCCGRCKSCAKKVLREAIQENAYAQSYPDAAVSALSPA